MKKYIIAITGASGAIYGWRFLEELIARKYFVNLIISDAGKIVLKKELNIEIPSSNQKAQKILGKTLKTKKFSYFDFHDISAEIASGSNKWEAMIVCPCSMGTLASIANGISQNLILRSADVTIKENRPLILVPREMPLSNIHLHNMLKLSKIGVCIAPAMPAFYHMPKKVDDLVDFVIGKVLDLIEIKHNLFRSYLT